MNIVKIKCALCSNEFFRRAGQYREALKFSWKQYCSFACRDKAKILIKEFRCGNLDCNKVIFRIPSEIRKSLSGRVFCSQTCAAIYNNHIRIKYNNCGYCGKIIRNWNKYCSFKCSVEKRRKPLDQTRLDIMSRIQMFHKTHERIPVKREVYGLYKTARMAFGSWNKAVEASGFDANPVLFAKRFIAKDGHVCDSFTEKIIDDWLCDNEIKHERNFPYKNTRFTADFRISSKIIIEFFGLAGVQKNYDEIIIKKRIASEKLGLKLIELYPNDIYPKNKLPILLEKLL